jgi:hypothetical protein
MSCLSFLSDFVVFPQQNLEVKKGMKEMDTGNWTQTPSSHLIIPLWTLWTLWTLWRDLEVTFPPDFLFPSAQNNFLFLIHNSSPSFHRPKSIITLSFDKKEIDNEEEKIFSLLSLS